MGHTRLGRLPKRDRWVQVVDLLTADHGDTAAVAAASVVAAEDYLRSLATDPALTRSYWLLVRLMSASRAGRLAPELEQLGVEAADGTSAVALLTQLSDRLRADIAQAGSTSVAGEYATQAFRRALLETVATQATSLFGGTVEDLERAFRAHSTERQFGEVSQKFFGDFLARVLTAALDREIPNVLSSVAAGTEVLAAVDLHARQSAGIVRDFAGEWLSKRGWETGQDIPQADAERFTAVALRKIRSELKREAQSS